jgi:hypothetical protein
MTPAKASFTPSLTRAPRLENGLGQIYAFDDRRKIGRSADESGHLLLRLLGPATRAW